MLFSHSWFFRTTFPWLRLPDAGPGGATAPRRSDGAVARYRGWRVTFSPPRAWLDLAALRRSGYPATILSRH